MQLDYFSFLKGPNPAISPFLQSTDMLNRLNGANISYELGAILKDLGYVRVGDAAIETGKEVTSLYNFRQSSSVQKMLATANNAGDTALQLFYSTGGNWAEITQAETDWNGYEDSIIDYETFIGYSYMVGYDANDGVYVPTRSLTGTTFGTTNLTNAPNGKFIQRYRDRLYIANAYYGGAAYPYRVRLSDSVTAGALPDWDFDENFFDVDYGEEITGLGSNWDILLIFTEYGVWYYDQTQLKKLADVGCSSNRTIHNIDYYTIWANSNGVWTSGGGSKPQNIAGEVIDFIRGANMRNAIGATVNREYHLYLGNVVVGDISYSNLLLTYNLATQTWRWRELYDNMSAFALYNDSGKDRLWMGSDNGFVWNKSRYSDAVQYYADSATTTDDGKPITAIIETAPVIIDARLYKRAKGMTTYAKRAQGVKIKMRVLDKNARILTDYEPIGELTDFVNDFEFTANKGNMLQFQFTETSTNPYFSLYGFSVEVEKYSNTPKK